MTKELFFSVSISISGGCSTRVVFLNIWYSWPFIQTLNSNKILDGNSISKRDQSRSALDLRKLKHRLLTRNLFLLWIYVNNFINQITLFIHDDNKTKAPPDTSAPKNINSSLLTLYTDLTIIFKLILPLIFHINELPRTDTYSFTQESIKNTYYIYFIPLPSTEDTKLGKIWFCPQGWINITR